jgi:hypothetical protein
MRLRISLFELLLFVVPAFAVALGLLVASAKSAEVYLVTIAQSLYLAGMFAAICASFQRTPGVRVFGSAFLAASLGHMLLFYVASQSNYASAFPTTLALTRIWEQANPGVVPAATVNPQSGLSSWSGSGMMPGGYTGGMFPGGSSGFGFPIYVAASAVQRPIFVEVGIWAISLLVGVLCGVTAKSLRGSEDSPLRSPFPSPPRQPHEGGYPSVRQRDSSAQQPALPGCRGDQ